MSVSGSTVYSITESSETHAFTSVGVGYKVAAITVVSTCLDIDIRRAEHASQSTLLFVNLGK